MIFWFGVVVGIALVEVGLMLIFSNTPLCNVLGGFSCAWGGMWLSNIIVKEKKDESD